MRAVQIHSIKQNYNFIMSVRGRIHPHPKVCQNTKSNGKHLFAILSDRTGIIRLIAYSKECNVDAILQKLKTDKIISISGSFEVRKELNVETFHKYHLKLDNNTVIDYINDDTVKPMDFPRHRFKSEKDLIYKTRNNSIADVKGIYLGETKITDHQNSYTVYRFQIGLSKIMLSFWDKFVTATYAVGTTLEIYNVTIIKNDDGNFYGLSLNMYSHVQCVRIEPSENSSCSTSLSINGETTKDISIKPAEFNKLLRVLSMTRKTNHELVTIPKVSVQSIYFGKPPSNNPKPKIILKISRQLPNQIPSASIKRKNIFEDNQAMLKIKKISNSNPSEQFEQLFNAFLTVLMNMPSDEEKCNFLRKSFK